LNHEYVIAYTFTSQDLKNELDEERREPYVSSGLINVCMVFDIVFVHW